MTRFNKQMFRFLCVSLFLLLASASAGAQSNSAASSDSVEEQPSWGFELGTGIGSSRNTSFIKTLNTFGYDGLEGVFGAPGRRSIRYALAIEKHVNHNFSLLLQGNNLDAGDFDRVSTPGKLDNYSWNTWALGVHARLSMPFSNFRSRIYAQLGVGPTITRDTLSTHLSASAPATDFTDTSIRYHITALAGAEYSPWRHIGMYVQGGYVYAPSLKNQLGQRHDSGGALVIVGLRARTWR